MTVLVFRKRLTKIKGNMLLFIYCTLILPSLCLHFDILDNGNIRRSLEYLCPGVGICERDVADTESTYVDSNGYMSCCQGCSCHAKCHLRLNCCFPKDISNSTTDSGDAGNEIEENRVANMPVLPSLIHGRRTDLRQTTTETIQTTRLGMDITTNSKHDGFEFPPMQCQYARTGDPDQYWIGSVSAFRMITRAPLGGCTPNSVCERLVNQDKEATCDDDVSFPWGGDLYPVYSRAHQLIFKNELCACCHGVSEYEQWTALVVCDLYTWYGQVPIADHFNFLQATNNMSSKHCHVSFSFDDINVLLQNTCYMDTIDECIDSTDSLFEVPDGVILTHSEVIEACQNGPNAPVILDYDYRAFKNVFCAMCNTDLTNHTLQCMAELRLQYYSDNVDVSFIGDVDLFTYVLDTTVMQGSFTGRSKTQPVPYPTACLQNNGILVEESCRIVECPAGQLRNTRGLCKSPSKRWLNSLFEVGVELEYVDNDVSILAMLDSGVVTLNDVIDAFRNANPWPRWGILTMFHSTTDYSFPPRIAMYLAVVHTSNSERLAVQIQASMKLQWKVILNGTNIVFSQSFLKYTIMRRFPGPEQAEWVRYASKIPNIPANENVTWEGVFNRLPSLDRFPISLNKLLICEHTALLEGEFTIFENMVLLNMLTNKVMFDLEFDVLEINGRPLPHVCLSDTPLVLRLHKSGAPSLHYSTAVQILVVIICQIN